MVAFDAAIGFDSASHTFDGVGLTPAGDVFLSAYLTAQNTITVISGNVAANTATNVWGQ